MTKKQGKATKPIPVTLLSGFLGAGKTTLLEHILRNKDNLRCAIVVNDMAEVNIDAALVKSSKLLQSEERMVELHNGCICCTLREDLLINLRKLAKSKKFDAIVIESTGISEPMQVAETFFVEYGKKKEVLNNTARLDNCITVVDATTFFQELGSVMTLAQQYPTSKDADDRTVAHLLVDQIEFANVVLLNKADLATEQTLLDTEHLIRHLNPHATILRTTRSHAPLDCLLHTNRFSQEFAEKATGWMEDINSGIKHVPETEEYGISSFVFRSAKPFHPARLHAFIVRYWMLEEGMMADPSEEEEEEEEAEPEDSSSESEASEDDIEAIKARNQLECRQAQQRRQEDFGNIFRSKGFLWLGNPNRQAMFAEWNHAGNVLTFQPGGEWGMLTAMLQTKVPCQEIVFIGQHLKRDALVAALEACTLTAEEQATLAAAIGADGAPTVLFEDPFGPWPAAVPMPGADDGVEEEHEEHEEDEAPPAPARKTAPKRSRTALPQHAVEVDGVCHNPRHKAVKPHRHV